MALTICLILVGAVGNSIGATIFMNASIGPNNKLTIAALIFSIGVLGSQPCLLATWLVLSPQNLSRRIVYPTGVLFFLTAAYLATIAYVTALAFGDVVNVEPMLIIFALSIGMYLLAAIPISLFRWKSRRALSQTEANVATDESIQFGIRHIFVVMTAVAILIPLCQWLFRDVVWPRGAPWFEILFFIVSHCLLVWGAFLLSCGCVFATRRIVCWVSLVLYVAIAPVVVTALMSLYFSAFRSFDVGNYINTIVFVSGFSLAVTVVLSLYFSIGFRLLPVGNAGKK